MIPLAVTGVGIVSPLGLGFAAVRDALDRHAEVGHSAFRGSSTVLPKEKIPDPMVAEICDFDPTPFLGSKGLRNHDRFTLLLLVAAKQALEHAGLKKDGSHVVYAPERVGVCSATAYGALDSINEMVEVSELQDPRFLNPNRFPNTVINSAAGYVSIWEDLRAPNVTVVDGNCGALDAVLTSETHLCNGRADAFIVGGGEVLSAPLYLAFRKLDTLADRGRAYAPGHASGQGMRLGEAAAYLTLERQVDAERRAARVYGRVLGYGNTFEPPDSEAVLVHASERAVERAVRMAIEDARLAPADVDLVCASAGGLAPFDQAELTALERVLGPDVPVAAPKALFGETFGASGALGIVSALAWLDGAAVGPLVRGAVPTGRAKPRCVVVVSVGFYGNASALIVAA